MSRDDGLLTIGELARRGGVPVRTLRFWSDEGLLPVSRRSRAGYRLYDGEALVRVELVVTLRELGFGHDAMTRVLQSCDTLTQVAATHVELVERQIQLLQRRRSVLRVIARRAPTMKEMQTMHELAKLTAAERQAILDDLTERVLEGVDPESPGTAIVQRLRELPPDLPDDPTETQLDAWIELASLATDPTFVTRVREMAVEGARGESTSFDPSLHARVMQHVPPAVARRIDPCTEDATAVLEQVTGEMNEAERLALRQRLETFTDPRVERYWQLLGILADRPPFPSMVEPYQWLIDALSARA